MFFYDKKKSSKEDNLSEVEIFCEILVTFDQSKAPMLNIS